MSFLTTFSSIFSQFKSTLYSSRVVQSILAWSKRTKPWGFEQMSIYEIIEYLIECIQKNNFGIKSAAIAFKFFLALFPSIVFFLALIPYIPIENFQANLMYEIDKITPPEIFTVIEKTINDLVMNKRGFTLSLGLLFTLYYASEGIGYMLSVFNESYHVKLKRNFFKQTIVSLGIFFLMSVFILVGLALITYGEVVAHDIFYKQMNGFLQFLFIFVKWIIVILCMIIGVSVLYNLGNPGRKKWKWISSGASLATITIILASNGLFYFFSNFSAYNELYGSIGSLMMILVWLNIICYILLVGFDLHVMQKIEKIEN
jgi:membrane protein